LAPKRILVISRQPPYGSSFAKEALDVALAASVFEQSLALLFLGDGVWQLLPSQQPELINSKNLGKQISALSVFGVEDVYIDSAALQQRQLLADSLIIPVKPLATAEIGGFIASFDTVLSF
jgi:tRNA 2-thiouridine synthesizing protein C